MSILQWFKHKILGYDYINWSNSADDGVARVFRTPDGKVCYWRYRSIRLLDVIKNKDQVIWLTCPPSKYGF